MQEKGIKSESEFARRLQVLQVTINNQLSGRMPISANVIFSIANEFPDISLEWLIRGNGEMYIDKCKSENIEEVQLPNIEDNIVNNLLKQNHSLLKTNENLSNKLIETIDKYNELLKKL
jgi:plasmid maintenance system antidote protein VapI